MENQTKIYISIGLIILTIVGYSIVGNINLESTHYCEEREIKAYCYSLSPTMKTCYTEMNKTGGKRCNIWKEIGAIDEILISRQISSSVWKCPAFGKDCIKID